jgi:hypothetical protein
MLACIPSARDACEHDYSTFQHPILGFTLSDLSATYAVYGP